MKIALLNTMRIWGGGEAWTLEAARALTERGHGVTIVAAEGETLARRTRACGLEVLDVPPGVWRRARSVPRLSRALADAGAEIYLAMNGRDLRFARRLRGRTAAPIVLRRGLDRPLADHPFRRRAWRSVDALIANSEATRRTVCANLPWFPPERIHVIHNAVDADRFLEYAEADVRGELGIPADAFVTGIVGRLTLQKGHDVFLEAARAIREAVPGAVFLVVGDGELRDVLKEKAQRSGLKEACIFTGEVEAPQPFYRACDVVTVPSRFEGFGYTSIEAQLLGRPVVASDVSSLPETLRIATGDGPETGILVPPGEPEGLARAVIALARDPQRRSRMGEAGRRFVRERFDAPPLYDALERLLVAVSRREPARRARA